MINVYCQHQLKETGEETTDLFERFKVWHISVETPGGVGGEKERFFFFRAQKTLSQLSLIRLAASSCHQRDQQGGLALIGLIGQRTGTLHYVIARSII